MAFPIRICAECGEEFELKPDKPGFANRCPDCSAADESAAATSNASDQANSEMNAERRKAIRDLLYRKDG
jgi:hypothetical protein